MAFKLKSGNKVSFKNMGGSPVKQVLNQREPIILPSGDTIEGLQITSKTNKGLVTGGTTNATAIAGLTANKGKWSATNVATFKTSVIAGVQAGTIEEVT